MFSIGFFLAIIEGHQSVETSKRTPSETINFKKSSKQREFADDNFEFAENGRKFSQRVENTVGNTEIACYEQFLLFPPFFQRTSTAVM